VPDRVPSDHATVETHRVPLESVGRTDRPQVRLPDGLDLSDGEVVRLALDGDTAHALVETDLDGDRVVRHAGDNPRVAREREPPDRLAEWVEDGTVSTGGTVHLDVVTAGHAYGLRTPGERVVYTATDGPDASLADIAGELDE